MMSPDGEPQHSDEEELELVDYHQQQHQQQQQQHQRQLTPQPRRRHHHHHHNGHRRHNNHHNHHPHPHRLPRQFTSPSSRYTTDDNGDYQVVADMESQYRDHDEDDDDHDHDDEDDETYTSGEDEGLISQVSVDRTALFGNGGHHNSGNTVDDYFYYGFSTHNNAEAAIDWRCAFWLVVSFLLAAFMAVVLPSFNNFGKPIVKDDGTVIFPNGTKTTIVAIGGPPHASNVPGSSASSTTSNIPGSPSNINGNVINKTTSHTVKHFQCPTTERVAANYYNSSVEESYKNRTSQIDANFTGFLQTYHESEFDGWGKTYDFVKAGMYHWKSTRFPKNLNDGDTIYESACGIGLNLIMTLEILQEVKGVNNLIVYGNEYIPSSANTSNRILDSLLPNLNATKGSICAADSTNLQYIPSNSFDLVFTGYISTLLDPLNLDQGVKSDYQYYESICEGDSWQDKKLKEVAQQRQNDWFGAWVSEMVRIAKPGAPVIVEQVSYPFCEAYFDWGGVSQDFWTDYAIEKYGWPVDPASIEFEDDRLFRKRYHVFMRKHAPSLTNVTKAAAAPPPQTLPPPPDATAEEEVSGGGGG